MLDYFLELTQTYLETGNIMVLIIVFIGGILTSFTPCLYPVIPLTIAYFGSQSDHSRFKVFRLAVVYVLGVSLVYTVLGIVAALTGTLFGRVSNHPYMYLTLGVIFVTLGISMLGVFNFSLNRFFQPQNHAEKKGYVASFVVGCSSGLVLGACATPIMAVLLAYVAAKQSVWFGGSLLFSFAVGKGLLLIAIGTFSGMMKFLPKAGNWMNVVKKILALVVIGMGVFYLMKTWQALA